MRPAIASVAPSPEIRPTMNPRMKSYGEGTAVHPSNNDNTMPSAPKVDNTDPKPILVCVLILPPSFQAAFK